MQLTETERAVAKFAFKPVEHSLHNLANIVANEVADHMHITGVHIEADMDAVRGKQHSVNLVIEHTLDGALTVNGEQAEYEARVKSYYILKGELKNGMLEPGNLTFNYLNDSAEFEAYQARDIELSDVKASDELIEAIHNEIDRTALSSLGLSVGAEKTPALKPLLNEVGSMLLEQKKHMDTGMSM